MIYMEIYNNIDWKYYCDSIFPISDAQDQENILIAYNKVRSYISDILHIDQNGVKTSLKCLGETM